MATVIKKIKGHYYLYHAYRDERGKVRTDYMYPVVSQHSKRYRSPEHGGGKQ